MTQPCITNVSFLQKCGFKIKIMRLKKAWKAWKFNNSLYKSFMIILQLMTVIEKKMEDEITFSLEELIADIQ